MIADRRTNAPVPHQRAHAEGSSKAVPAPLARPGTFVYEPGSCEGGVGLVIGPGPSPEQVWVHHYGVDDAHPALLADLKPFADGQHVRVGSDFGDPS